MTVGLRKAARSAMTVLVVLMVVVLGMDSQAWAHTELRSTTPAADATADAALREVQLVFSSGVKQQFTTVAVTDAAGGSYSDGASRVTGQTVTQPVRALPGGPITVTWRTVADDGAPAQGTFTFVGGGAVAPGAIASGVSDVGSAPRISDTAVAGGTYWRWWWLTAVGVALLVGAAGTVGWPWLRPRLAGVARRGSTRWPMSWWRPG